MGTKKSRLEVVHLATFSYGYDNPWDSIFALMKSNSSIKEKIYEIRRKKGISQEKMAQMLGISDTSFRKLESGKTTLVSNRLWNIAKILEVSLEELML